MDINNTDTSVGHEVSPAHSTGDRIYMCLHSCSPKLPVCQWGGELAESQPTSRELSALQDTTERLQKEVLPLGYWNFIIPDQNDDLKDLVQDDYVSGKTSLERAPGNGKNMREGARKLASAQTPALTSSS